MKPALDPRCSRHTGSGVYAAIDFDWIHRRYRA